MNVGEKRRSQLSGSCDQHDGKVTSLRLSTVEIIVVVRV